MRGRRRPRALFGATSALFVVAALVASAFVYTNNASAAPSAYNSRAILVHPQAQFAGKPSTTTGDAKFGCQEQRAPGAIVCYGPDQIRHAFGVDKLISRGITGKGHTIVIVDAFQNPDMVQDLQAFDSVFGLPDPQFQQIVPDGLTPFDPNDANMSGWAGEIALDVQWSHAMAPGAKIVLVLAKSNQDADLLSVTKYAVDHNLGDVISQSFGENENCVDPKLLKDEHKVFEEATKKHITLLASSGDEGAAQQTCDGSSWVQVASSPASDPLVTAVGATELFAAPECTPTLPGTVPCAANAPAPGTYDHEIALNEPAGEFTEGNFSTGGGFSDLYKRPQYQRGISGIPGNHRGVPDIAFTGSINHGVLASFQVGGGFFIFGGTSVGSPCWAGLVALGDQLAGRNLGFINSSLYRLGDSRSLAAVSFHDTTVGDNTVQEPDANGNFVTVQGFNATKGWDATTGFGTPKVQTMIPLLVALNYFDDGTKAIADPASQPSR